MQAALEELKKGAGDGYRRSQYWDEILNAIAFEGDDPESENMDYVCNNDVMAAIAIECSRPELDEIALNPMTTVTTMIGLSSRNAAKTCASKTFFEGLLRVAKEKIPSSIGAYALTSLTNLALHSESHQRLLQVGGLQFALGLLHYLDGETNNEIDVGLTSASFICRVVGKEESGPGPDAIKANSKLVEKLLWILTAVLDAGPDGRVIGYHWNPANILSDVATLATSDRNKPLLVDFVEQLTRALELRSDNRRAARLAIIALSQLSFEPRCKPKFEEFKERLNKILDFVITTFPEDEMDAKRNAQVLKATINETEKPVGDDKKKKVGLLRAAKAVLGTAKLTPPEKGGSQTGHVMISYQWGSQTIAIEIEKRLRAAGIKTWFDLNDMQDNVNDSMVFAVENACAMIILFSRKYKESGNCRKECEMGDNLNKPMIFVRAEKDYRPEAWLNFIMGKTTYIECFGEGMIETSFPLISKRVAPHLAVPIKASQPSNFDNAAAGGSQLMKSLNTVLAQMKVMQDDIKEMKAEIKQLQSVVGKGQKN